MQVEVKKDLNEPCCNLKCINATCNKICFKLYKDRTNMEAMLDGIILSDIQKHHVQSRYINILENFKKRVHKYAFVFFLGHFIITVGSLFVPALLSIQNSNVSFTVNGYSVPIYIITFIVSLLVTIFNGILTLFKVDKKYYFLTTTMEKLRSEGWQYFGLTGRYASKDTITSTHKNQFTTFINQIEKIKMRQVEEEFYKTDDPNADPKKELYPLSLNQSISSLGTAPDLVRSAMKAIVIQNDDMNRHVTAPSIVPIVPVSTDPIQNQVILESPRAAAPSVSLLASVFEDKNKL